MLRSLRAAAKTKVAGIIIGALVLAFALWGVNDIFRGSAVNAVVAKVGGTEIPTADFERELRAQMRAVGQQTNSDITLEQARALGLDRAVLDNVVSRAALDEEARRFGATASNEAVAAKVRSTNAFFGADGSFNRAIFEQALQQYGISEAGFVEATRRDMAREQLLSALATMVTAPPGMTRLIFDLVNETRLADFVVLTPADAGSIPEPTEAELAAYHKAHADRFSAPEYRTIDYVVIAPAQVASDIAVSEEDIKAEFDAQKGKYEKAEQREVEQIAFRTKEEADAAAARLKSGADFAGIAKERGLKDEDVKLGTVTSTGLAPALSQAAFAAPEGGVTPPVQGPFGWVILRAVKVTPGETKSFDQLKDTIRADLIAARAQGKMADLANAFEDARGGGASLAEAAMKLNLPVHSVAAVDRMGLAPNGSKADVAGEMALLDQAFRTEAGEESTIFQGEDKNYYAVKVARVTPAAVKPLDTVRATVRESWMTEARANALKKRAEMLAEDARKGSLAAAAQTLKKTPIHSMPIRRNQQNDVYGPQVLQQLFSQPKGGVAVGPQPNGPNYIVAQIVDVSHPVPDFTNPSYVQFRNVVAQQLSEDMAQTVAAAARAHVGVTTYPAAVQSVLGETPQ